MCEWKGRRKEEGGKGEGGTSGCKVRTRYVVVHARNMHMGGGKIKPFGRSFRVFTFVPRIHSAVGMGK